MKIVCQEYKTEPRHGKGGLKTVNQERPMGYARAYFDFSLTTVK